MLLKPYLAKCDNRSIMPQCHPTSGSPEEWFSNEMLIPNQLFGLTFDFFVDWSVNPNVITPVIWQKRILDKKYSYSELIINLNEELISEFGLEYLNRLNSFANHYNLKVQFIVFRDDFDWSNSSSEILIIDLNYKENGEFSFVHSIITIDTFKNLIRVNSGGSINIGTKGLIYGTSKLECYLSSTDSLYPGDVDLIILNKENKLKCILEFKKHTLVTPISEQQLSNYYPRPDGRKYNRISLLADYFSTNNKIPILVVYYPTKDFITEVKFELIKGSNGQLYAAGNSIFPLPKMKSGIEYQKIIDRLNKIIDSQTTVNIF